MAEESDIQQETVAPEATPVSTLPVTEPGLSDELHKIGAAIKTNPFFPEVSYILHWRDPIRTGLIFGIINLAYFLVYYGEYSVVTLFNYCALALLGTAFAYAYGLILWARYVQGHIIENPLSSRWSSAKVVVSRTVVEKHVDSVCNLVNALLEVMRDVYYCSFPFLAVKFASIFFAQAMIGKWISGIVLSYIVTLIVFAWPRLYEEQKAKIDQYYKLVQDQIQAQLSLAIAKLPFPKPSFDKRKTK
eukprot:Phypoly_transcript_14562.p1 GENE.Phypoly_transcript_14562~~Phypoly_transcript_14562.p1  ORF type:complete len:246 (+),score=18.86 Phypoly_transcript_14562:154-891(+)